LKKNTGHDTSIEAQCTFCGVVIELPKLKITIGKKVNRKSKQTFVEEDTNFISAERLKEKVEDILQKP